MKKYVLAVLMVSVLFVGCTKPVEKQENVTAQESIQVLEEAIPVEENGGIGDGAEPLLEESAEEQEMLQAQIVAFSTEKLLEIQGEQKFIIFFHANWCPTCIRWEKMVRANLRELPEDTVILMADYDNKAIRNAFGISKQSTAIFYDLEGSRVDDVLDPSLEEVISFFSS